MTALFSPRMNQLPRRLAWILLIVGLLIAGGTYYICTPKTWRVGFSPEQPIPFSHKVHVDQLGMDCAACHSSAAYSSRAGIPDANSCFACHRQILPESPRLRPLHASVNKTSPDYNGLPLTWTKVCRLPGYAVFNHSAHVNRGVACTSCHGDVARMDRVTVSKSLSMAWCLDCHRNPAPQLVPLEKVTDPDYNAEQYLQKHPLCDRQGTPVTTPAELQSCLKENWRIQPRQDCAACHH